MPWDAQLCHIPILYCQIIPFVTRSDNKMNVINFQKVSLCHGIVTTAWLYLGFLNFLMLADVYLVKTINTYLHKLLKFFTLIWPSCRSESITV